MVKVGDLIMTACEVEEYAHCTNKMAIIRRVIDRAPYCSHEVPARHRCLYKATLLSSGEEVELWRHEFELAGSEEESRP